MYAFFFSHFSCTQDVCCPECNKVNVGVCKMHKGLTVLEEHYFNSKLSLI